MDKVKNTLDSMSSEIDELLSQSLGESGQHLFDICLTAAFAKSFEFTRYVHKNTDESDSFFLSGTLRGICEDLIFLKVIRELKPKDRKELLVSRTLFELHRSISKQENFLKENNPDQEIITSDHFSVDIRTLKDKIEEIKENNKIKGDGHYLKTWDMAQKAGLYDLYDYLYHATSKLVHFDTKVLMRMGWGESDSPKEDFEFSTKNFDSYYDEFNKFYSVYLLVEFSKTFGGRMGVGEDLHRRVDELSEWIEDQPRWPELVTPEEMNRTIP